MDRLESLSEGTKSDDLMRRFQSYFSLLREPELVRVEPNSVDKLASKWFFAVTIAGLAAISNTVVKT